MRHPSQLQTQPQTGQFVRGARAHAAIVASSSPYGKNGVSFSSKKLEDAPVVPVGVLVARSIGSLSPASKSFELTRREDYDEVIQTTSEPKRNFRMSAAAPVAAPTYTPGLEGVIAGETAISSIQDGLRYRGYPVGELVDKATFDEVAYLLLYGDLPKAGELKTFRARLSA